MLQRIGQCILLRKRIQYQLRVAASFQAKQLQLSVGLVNSLMAEVQMSESQRTPTAGNIPNDEVSNLAFEALTYSEPLGLYDPYAKIYMTVEPIQNLSGFLSVIVVNQLHKLVYSKSLGKHEIF